MKLFHITMRAYRLNRFLFLPATPADADLLDTEGVFLHSQRDSHERRTGGLGMVGFVVLFRPVTGRPAPANTKCESIRTWCASTV
jgi:hypothetical protein